MNANAKKWVAALRSGKFKQGIGQLRRGDKYCCLGVGCEVAKLEIEVQRRKTAAGHFIYDGQSGVLPSSVQNWLRLRSTDGAMAEGRTLIGLNDKSKTFAEIADIIESEPLGLFVDPKP